jgi:hypothetical protein
MILINDFIFSNYFYLKKNILHKIILNMSYHQKGKMPEDMFQKKKSGFFCGPVFGAQTSKKRAE